MTATRPSIAGIPFSHKALVAIVLLAVTVNIIAIAADRTPIAGDAAGKAYEATRFRQSLAPGGLSPWMLAFHPDNLYPPLLRVFAGLASFPAALFPDPEWIFLAVQLFYAALIVAVFVVGRRLFAHHGSGPALLAAFFAGVTPGLFGMSKVFMHDLPLTSMVWINLAVLLSTQRFRNRRVSLLFGLTCGLGMLTKQAFGVFVALPLLIVVARSLFDGEGRKGAFLNMVLSAAVVLAVAGPWYVLCFPDTYARYSQYNRLPQAFGELALSSYYLEAFRDTQVRWVLSALALAGALRVLISPSLLRRYPWVPVAVPCLAFPYAYIAATSVISPRFLLPLVPAAAVFASLAIFAHGPTAPRAPRRAVQAVVTVLAIGWGLFQFGYLSLAPQGKTSRLPAAIQHLLGQQGAQYSDTMNGIGLFRIDRRGMSAPYVNGWVEGELAKCESSLRRLLVMDGTAKQTLAPALAKLNIASDDPWQIALWPMTGTGAQLMLEENAHWPCVVLLVYPEYDVANEDRAMAQNLFDLADVAVNRDRHFIKLSNKQLRLDAPVPASATLLTPPEASEPTTAEDADE